MQRTIALLCAIGACALLGYGMTRPVERDITWIMLLWAAAPLLLIAARLSMPTPPRGTARSIYNLGLIIVVGFGLLAAQLLRQQYISAAAISSYSHTDPLTGETTSNVRPVLAALRVRRGEIRDRNGVVLVSTRIAADNYAVRTYPIAERFDARAFGNVVGFFSSRFGQSGVEASYGDYLNGSRDSIIALQESLLGRPGTGDDVTLTIDAALQAAAFDIIGDRRGSIVVLDSQTGAVLAMVSRPGFDPRGLAFDPTVPRADENARIDAAWRAINADAAGQPLLNRPTQGRYPPGSTYKAITAIGALQYAREVQPDTIDCPNTRETEVGAPPVVNAVDDLAVRTGNPSNLERVFAYSCNTAFAEYALRLGPDRMAEIAARFDIVVPQDADASDTTLADLPGVPSLLYADPGFLNRRPALADTGYGQGQLLVTPLQMALVAAAVANDGVIMQPYLVQRVTRADGTVLRNNAPRTLRRAMSGEVAATMRRNMRAVVEYGFGQAAGEVPGVQVGGKSGTAEFPCPVDGDPGRICTHAWYIALAPVEQPRFAVVVMIEGGGEGSSVGAATAGAVLRAAFSTVQP